MTESRFGLPKHFGPCAHGLPADKLLVQERSALDRMFKRSQHHTYQDRGIVVV